MYCIDMLRVKLPYRYVKCECTLWLLHVNVAYRCVKCEATLQIYYYVWMYLIYAVLVGLQIEPVVQVVEHVDHVQRGAGGSDGREVDDVAEQDGHLVELLWTRNNSTWFNVEQQG